MSFAVSGRQGGEGSGIAKLNSQLVGPLAVLGLLAMLGACAPLPDATPFSESTLQLRAAMASGHIAVDGELRATKVLDAEADKLKAAWKLRLATADGMIAYAESIVALTEAGNKGDEAVAEVANSVKSLAASANVALPQAPVAVATNAAELIALQIANIRARNTLAEAMWQAQLAVATVAELVAKDVGDMIDILRTATKLSDIQLQTKHQAELGDRDRVLAERKRIYGEGSNAETARSDLARLEVLGHALKDMDAWYLPFEAERKAIRDREAAGRTLLAAIRQAVLDWASAHRQLALAVKQGGRVDPKALAESITEIRELIWKVREL